MTPALSAVLPAADLFVAELICVLHTWILLHSVRLLPLLHSCTVFFCLQLQVEVNNMLLSLQQTVLLHHRVVFACLLSKT
jgi:hypothetical protein